MEHSGQFVERFGVWIKESEQQWSIAKTAYDSAGENKDLLEESLAEMAYYKGRIDALRDAISLHVAAVIKKVEGY
jgi:hypothetical protein